MATMLVGKRQVLVDDHDLPMLMKYSWTIEKRGDMFYARGVPKGVGASKAKKVYMHRLILSAKPGTEIDHEDRNGLNNLRSNIRISSRSDNSHNKVMHKSNTSGCKGVYFDRARGRWFAKLKRYGKEHKRGYFIDIQDAINAYTDLAYEVLGSKARISTCTILGST